jgi:hypothetical protein
MSGATEIYICQPGQALNEGRVEYGTMESRDDAASDAERRCKFDPTIAKIAYYTVTGSGKFHSIYTHENPNAAKPVPARKRRGVTTKASSRRARPVKRSLIDKIRMVFEED